MKAWEPNGESIPEGTEVERARSGTGHGESQGLRDGRVVPERHRVDWLGILSKGRGLRFNQMCVMVLLCHFKEQECV